MVAGMVDGCSAGLHWSRDRKQAKIQTNTLFRSFYPLVHAWMYRAALFTTAFTWSRLNADTTYVWIRSLSFGRPLVNTNSLRRNSSASLGLPFIVPCGVEAPWLLGW